MDDRRGRRIDGRIDVQTPQPVLVDTPDDEERKVPEPLTIVRVLAPYRVVHDGVAYTGDAIAEVPESLAQEWVLNRWAEHG